ncbi:hypothetical protein M5X00_23170 [Paenibacillus alvei]|uniref:Uncharacterized protein n=1 Tax=Paenibacillus alvei TaxID=44250 RepID=A0ABT4H3A2_PAEAL|nr:hypothetical protein [Paenibacillus alvei]EJW14308.1 hypothetical protein PAV_14c00010 [Paenibacillus alvei DSM 29]MCY9540562.1 hypothetical protein [Paenibacillus alvei]MCY9736135.1 hypothetical protein [Paenibacillus alvei]MCY9757144.1 hypothetical protein [Paenibacillus alvei]MCY9763152.1 hypothetical protein [Paenibacillus alvei]
MKLEIVNGVAVNLDLVIQFLNGASDVESEEGTYTFELIEQGDFIQVSIEYLTDIGSEYVFRKGYTRTGFSLSKLLQDLKGHNLDFIEEWLCETFLLTN